MNGRIPLYRKGLCALLLWALLLTSGAHAAPNDRALAIEGGMPIPYISQLDYGKPVCRVMGQVKSVRTSGCGATCASMVIRHLTGERGASPQALFDWAYDSGHYFGQGLGHECLEEMLRLNGVEGRWIENSKVEVYLALLEKKPVIAHLGPGTFTREGHYIVLRGVDQYGRVYVNDPSSLQRSTTAYPLDMLISQARNAAAFMICSPIEGWRAGRVSRAEARGLRMRYDG